MKVIIDRFEEEFAVVELPDGKMLNVPKVLFENAREGDEVEITVLGKPYEQKDNEAENPTGLFEKLRKKSKKREKADNPPAEE